MPTLLPFPVHLITEMHRVELPVAVLLSG